MRRRWLFWYRAFRKGLPSLWWLLNVLSLLVGLSVLAILALGVGRPLIAAGVTVAAFLLVLEEGAFRLSPDAGLPLIQLKMTPEVISERQVATVISQQRLTQQREAVQEEDTLDRAVVRVRNGRESGGEEATAKGVVPQVEILADNRFDYKGWDVASPLDFTVAGEEHLLYIAQKWRQDDACYPIKGVPTVPPGRPGTDEARRDLGFKVLVTLRGHNFEPIKAQFAVRNHGRGDGLVFGLWDSPPPLSAGTRVAARDDRWRPRLGEVLGVASYVFGHPPPARGPQDPINLPTEIFYRVKWSAHKGQPEYVEQSRSEKTLRVIHRKWPR